MARSPSGHRNSIAVCETPTSPGSSLPAPGERAEGKTQKAKEQEEEEGDDDAFESLTLPKYDSRPVSMCVTFALTSLTTLHSPFILWLCFPSKHETLGQRWFAVGPTS